MFTIGQRAELEYYLDYVIEHCMLAVAFFLPLSLNVTSVFLAFGSALWLFKMPVQKKILFKRTAVDIVIGCYVLLSGLSVLISPDYGFSIYNYIHLMGRYILVYYLIVNNVSSKEQLRRLVWALLLGALFVTCYGLYQYFHGIDISALDWVDKEQFPDLTVRVFSTLGNPNLLAAFLVIMMAIAGGMALCNRTRIFKILLFLLTILMALCLVYTYSRGAWISILAVALFYSIINNRRIMWFFLLLPIIGFFAHNAILERLTSILNPTDTSATMRMALWESTFAMISAKPWLGIGWGAYWLVYPQYDFYVNDISVKIFHAHNTYLHIAAEIGIPGFLAFMLIAYMHLRKAITVMRANTGCWLGGLMLGAVGANVAMAINGLTDHILFNTQLCMLFWLTNAMIVVAEKE